MSEPSIITRIEAALEKARWRALEIRAIYLTKEDHDDLDAASSWEGFKVSVLTYKDHQIRRGERSCVYFVGGDKVVIGKRVSPRLQVAA